jgi:cobaltochelatase CobN
VSGIARGGHQGGAAVAVDPEEGLGCGGGAAGVDRNLEVAVGPVLEADGHGEAGGELAVDLAFRGPRSDGAPGNEVGHVLRADGLEELGGGGEPQGGDLLQEAAGRTQAAGDVVAAVQVRIVDEALPADRGAGLFEVGPQDDEQVFLVLLGLADQPAGVFQAGLGVVDGARTDDHQQAVVHAVHDCADFVAAAFDDVGRLRVQRQFRNHLLGRGQGGDLTDPQVRRRLAFRRRLLGFGGCCAHFRGPVPGGSGPLIRTRRRYGEGQRMISALLALKESWMRVS